MARKHSVPDKEKWELYEINIKQTYDDSYKAYAALELYFKRIELADLGKVPVPQNSDLLMMKYWEVDVAVESGNKRKFSAHLNLHGVPG
ncbi:hypothetical protein OUZ56_029717 [Daphnia magna]|uniref:Uncharacterized protein n=1 Tax=Daphnia magna TaxID=35525 RepID=A0ABR0B7R8_9CRUS|nr:hypothetical protein OUZ56_029717 [Daphnia magna]